MNVRPILSRMVHPSVPAFAFPLLGAVLGACLIDLDHPLSVLLQVADGRFLHLPALLLSGAALALSGGLLACRSRVHQVDGAAPVLNKLKVKQNE